MAAEFDDDRDAVIQRAVSVGVARIVAVGYDLATSRAAIDLATRYNGVYATVGIHPCHVAQAGPGDFEAIEELTVDKRVVGVGETGIDLYWDKSTFPLQERAFRWHIELGKKTGLPVIVHDRDAHIEVMTALADAGASEASIVLHCFTGDENMAYEAVAAGYHLGFGGVVTFKKNTIIDVAARLPLDRLLIETDSPYLAPVPYRGKRNEPAHVRHTAEALARVREITVETLGAATSENACRVFQRMS